MDLTLKVWRQANPGATGAMETLDVRDISPDMSFLEMLDIVNDRLTTEGKEPIAFEHDCREGICGSCGMMINGQAHGPQKGTATCQLHMRKFADGATTQSTSEQIGRSVDAVYKNLAKLRQTLFECVQKSLAREGPS